MPFDTDFSTLYYNYITDYIARSKTPNWRQVSQLRVLPLSGKKYIEFKILEISAGYIAIGISPVPPNAGSAPGYYLNGYCYFSTGTKCVNSTQSSYGSAWGANDIIGMAYDITSGKIYWAKNGVWQNDSNPATGINPAFTGISSGKIFIAGASAENTDIEIRDDVNLFYYPPPDGYTANAQLTNESFFDLRIASVAEAFRSLQLAPASRAETWKGIQVRKATPAEKAYQIYVDTAARLEKTALLSVIATMGFEAFAPLLVKGSLAAFEQFASLSIDARERMVFEVYQRLAVLGEVDNNIFEQSAGLIIDNSVVEFISFQEQGGLYYRQFDVQVNVHPDTFPPRNAQFIRSLPLYASASLVLQSTLLLDSGPITQVDRVITLMYDGTSETSRGVDQQTGAETVTATLRLVSPTAGLGYLQDDRGSLRFTKSWPSGTMASSILEELFAGSGLSYDLRIDDFPIGQQLTVDNKFSFEIWPLLFIKERIRTGDDGDTLVIEPMLPCLPADLADQPLGHYLDPAQYMIQSITSDDGGQVRHNMIRVANYQDADAGAGELAAPELGDADSSGLTAVYGWPVPWRKVWLRGCHLPHDGYELRADGVAEELELTETVSFDGGTGRTQRPIHGLLSVDWAGNASLGTITPSEDGTLTAATAGKSVAVVRYKTLRYKFLYRDAEGDHKMSLWLTDEEG